MHLGTAAEYNVPWVIRYFIYGFMRSKNISRLSLPTGCALSDLPGPDQENYCDQIVNATKSESAGKVFEKLNCTHSPELFFCFTCLHGQAVNKASSKTLSAKRCLEAEVEEDVHVLAVVQLKAF